MALGKNFIATALACLAIVSTNQAEKLSFPSLFPDGKTCVYSYYAEVEAGLLEPAEFDSEYVLQGIFHISRHNSNALLVTFQNASFGLKNGRSEDSQNTSSSAPTPEAAKILEAPCLFHYRESGELKAVQCSEQESAWSQNMKFAWASLFQLTVNKVSFESPEETQGYISSEKTIYGECLTSYDVNAKYPGFNSTQTLVVTKFSSPSTCSNFNTQFFDYASATPDESLYNTANVKAYEIKKEDDNSLVLSKINSFGEFSYFPFSANKLDAYFIRDNVTFELKQIVPSSEISLPTANFENASLSNDWTYQSPSGSYAEGAAPDVTNGRHVVDQENIVSEAEQFLENAGYYVEESQTEARELNWQRSKTVNKILEILSRADISSFEKIFFKLQNQTSQAQFAARGIFLGILPQVGTAASSFFTWNLVKSRSVNDFEAMEMLTKFPFNVRKPCEEILAELEPMLSDNESLAPKVRKSTILAFSTLVSRTFSNSTANPKNRSIEKYVKMFCDRFFNETEYGFQLVYMSAISNIQAEEIYEYLAPIVRGEVKISKNPNYIRLLAIWATQKPLQSNYSRGFALYWPVMSNYNLPLSLRVAAFEYLINNAKSMTNFLRIHLFMSHEQSEHLYNYYYTVIKNLADSTDPACYQIKEYATKILRFTRVPASTSDNISTSQTIEKVDPNGNGFRFRFSIIYNEEKNVVEQFYMGQTFFEGYKIVSNWGFYLNIGGMDSLMRFLNIDILELKDTINQAFIMELIDKFPAAVAAMPDSHIDMVLLYRERSVMSNYYNCESWTHLKNDVHHVMKAYVTPSRASAPKNSSQVASTYHVFYHNLCEQNFINEMGIPFIFYGRSPAVYALKVSRNQTAKTRSTETQIDAKVWLIHEYAASVYNLFTDTWHSAGQTSMVVAHASFENNESVNPALEFLKMSNPKYWDFKFTGADVVMINKNSVSIDNYNANRLNSQSTYNREVIAAKNVNASNNSTIVLNHSDGFQWEITLYDCEDDVSDITGEKLVDSWKNVNNYGIDTFPFSIAMKNCANVIKIKQPNDFTPFA